MWSSDLEADGVATALTRMFVGQGLAAPSLRAIARETNGAASSLVSRFGGKEAMLVRAAHCFVEHYSFQLRDRAAWAGWPGLLPQCDEDRYWTVGRSAWMELARANEDFAAAMAGLVREEMEVVRFTASLACGGVSPADAEAMTAHALLVGLWARLAAQVEPLSVVDAAAIWDGHLGLLRDERTFVPANERSLAHEAPP